MLRGEPAGRVLLADEDNCGGRPVSVCPHTTINTADGKEKKHVGYHGSSLSSGSLREFC